MPPGNQCKTPPEPQHAAENIYTGRWKSSIAASQRTAFCALGESMRLYTRGHGVMIRRCNDLFTLGYSSYFLSHNVKNGLDSFSTLNETVKWLKSKTSHHHSKQLIKICIPIFTDLCIFSSQGTITVISKMIKVPSQRQLEGKKEWMDRMIITNKWKTM